MIKVKERLLKYSKKWYRNSVKKLVQSNNRIPALQLDTSAPFLTVIWIFLQSLTPVIKCNFRKTEWRDLEKSFKQLWTPKCISKCQASGTIIENVISRFRENFKSVKFGSQNAPFPPLWTKEFFSRKYLGTILYLSNPNLTH